VEILIFKGYIPAGARMTLNQSQWIVYTLKVTH